MHNTLSSYVSEPYFDAEHEVGGCFGHPYLKRPSFLWIIDVKFVNLVLWWEIGCDVAIVFLKIN